MFFRLNCRITDCSEMVSGKPHREVIRADGSSFFLDPAFLFALENINRENLLDRLCERFSASKDEAEVVISTIVKTRLVLAAEKEKMSVPRNDVSLKRPSVGILTERMKLGYGVDLVVHQTASGLSRRGYDVTVFTGSVDPIYESAGYEIVRLAEGERLSDVFSQEFFEHAVASLKRRRIDVWILESLPFYYWRDSLAGPVIFVEHGTPFPELFPKEMSLSVRLARLTKRERVFKAMRPYDRVVAISRFVASQLPPEAASMTRIIHNGCDHYPLIARAEIGAFREEIGVRDREFLMAYVGRIDLDGQRQPYKSVDRLIEVWRRVRVEMPQVRLMLAGRADTTTERQLMDMGVIPMLNIPEEKVALVLAAADLFVSMSLWEGFDLPLFEAQFQGTPCVVMRRGAHEELLAGTGAGVLAEDEAEFEGAIKKLARRRDLVSQMSARAKASSRRFRWETSVEQMRSLVEEVSAAFDAAGQQPAPGRPARARFGLAVAKEVLAHEGPVAFTKLAFDKLKRLRARRR